jgi:hypothetical protein
MKLKINENDNFEYLDENYKYETNLTNWLYNAIDSTNRRNNYANKLKESSLSKIFQHSKDAFIMVSACRNDYDKKMLKQKTNELANDIRKAGLGYIKTVGGYIEDGDENGIPVIEMSFFVPYNNSITPEEFKNLAIKWCNKYNQDTVLLKMPKEDTINYINKQGDIEMTFNDTKLDDKMIQQYFSYLVKSNHKGRRFYFEGIGHKYPINNMSRQIMQYKGEIF